MTIGLDTMNSAAHLDDDDSDRRNNNASDIEIQ